MSESAPFKDMFNPRSVAQLGDWVQKAWKAFPAKAFVDWVVPGLAERELKARSLLITEGLEQFLPNDFPKASKILIKALPAPMETEDLSTGKGDLSSCP